MRKLFKNVLFRLGMVERKLLLPPERSPEEKREERIQGIANIVRENVGEISDEMAQKYAEMFFMLDCAFGVQISTSHAIDKPLKAFLLSYTSGIENENAITLEVLSHESDVTKDHLIPSCAGDAQSSVESWAVLREAKRIYVEKLLQKLFDVAVPYKLIKYDDSKHYKLAMINLNICANEIASTTRRGVGNVLLIDSKNVDSLRDNLSSDVIVEEELDISKRNSRDSILRYEYTVQGHWRVFSSSLFDTIKNNRPENAIMLYSGASNALDAGIVLVIGKVFDKGDTLYSVVTQNDFTEERKLEYSSAGNYVRLLDIDILK